MNFKIYCSEFYLHITNTLRHSHLQETLGRIQILCISKQLFNELYFQASNGESKQLFLVVALFFLLRPRIVFN